MTDAIKLTEEISQYMKAKLIGKLQMASSGISYPKDWEMSLLYECNLAVNVIIEAQANKKAVNWDVEDYVNALSVRCTGQNVGVEEDLKRRFHPIHHPLKTEGKPCIVTDRLGRVLVWYLPGILTQQRSEQMWKDLKLLEPTLRVSTYTKSWRIGDTYFRAQQGWLKPGNANLSPGWFQQAHEKIKPLEVSADLTKPASLTWLETQVIASAIVGGILSIIHPELYESGLKTMKEIFNHPEEITKSQVLADVKKSWSSPFSVISVISNRNTPFHRDNGAEHSWYDVLMPLGEYRHGRMELPGIGITFKYNPGTVFAFVGRVLQHGAKCDGDRAVIAYYVKRHVIASFNIPTASWVHI